jgi:2,5-diketo-D-gluconate reductase A
VYARLLPCAAQYHPYLQQRELLSLCAAEGIVIAAYCPLGPLTLWPGGALEAPLASVAAAHGASPASVLLAWPLAQGHAAVTTGTRAGRAAEALAAAALTLRAEEVEALAAAGAAAPQRRRFWVDYFKDSPAV